MRSVLFLMAVPFLLSACPAVVVGAGAGGTVAAVQERSVGTNIDDKVIYSDISKRYLDAGNDLYYDVTIRVRHGRVMLTGIVPSQDRAQQAVSLAWQAKGVKEVINEILVGDSKFLDSANDNLIKKNFESRLLITKDVWVINYSIDVVNGTVYIMGRVADRAELDRVMNIARTTKGVKRVVSHLQIITEIPVSTTGAPVPSNAGSTYSAPAAASSYSASPAPADSGAYPPTDGTIGIDSVSSSDLSAPAGGGY